MVKQKVDGDEKSVLLRSFWQKLDEYINFSEINDQEFPAQKELERNLKDGRRMTVLLIIGHKHVSTI
ncbi:MAG: hypothetical protein U5K27_07510 [Desulfotignum sp.]|nr:hypothetical protein [Desulfotignum sp.]